MLPVRYSCVPSRRLIEGRVGVIQQSDNKWSSLVVNNSVCLCSYPYINSLYVQVLVQVHTSNSYIEKWDSDSFSLFVVKYNIRSLYREDSKSKVCCTY